MLMAFDPQAQMESHILVSRIKSLLADAPSFATYSPASPEHQAWLAQAHALASRWNSIEAISLKTAADFLSSPAMREINIAQIFGTLHRAVADLELKLPANNGRSFSPGEVYDFFKELNALIASAASSLLIVDPFIDDTVFDAYLASVPNGVGVRLLTSKPAANLKPAIQRFKAQHGIAIEARKSDAFHDRVIFIDGSDCWVVGTSIKDAAKSKPAYLVPLSQDIAPTKRADYELIWDKAQPI